MLARLDFKNRGCFRLGRTFGHFFAETLIFVRNSPKPKSKPNFRSVTTKNQGFRDWLEWLNLWFLVCIIIITEKRVISQSTNFVSSVVCCMDKTWKVCYELSKNFSETHCDSRNIWAILDSPSFRKCLFSAANLCI